MHQAIVWVQRILAAVAVYVLADPVTFAGYLPPEIASRYMAGVALVSAFLPSLVQRLRQVVTQDTVTTHSTAADGDTRTTAHRVTTKEN